MIDIHKQRIGFKFGPFELFRKDAEKIGTVNPRIGSKSEIDITSDTGMGKIGTAIVRREVGLTIGSVNGLVLTDFEEVDKALIDKDEKPLTVSIPDPLIGAYEITIKPRGRNKTS